MACSSLCDSCEPVVDYVLMEKACGVRLTINLDEKSHQKKKVHKLVAVFFI